MKILQNEITGTHTSFPSDFGEKLSFILYLLFPERLQSCYIYFYCSYCTTTITTFKPCAYLSFSISYWFPWSILWVSFFQSHILNALTYKSYVCISTPWFGLVWFCFVFKKVIELSGKSPCLWACFIPSFSGTWELICSVAHCKIPFTHTYICCIPKPAMILRITLFPQENTLDLTPMLWEKG